MSGNPPRNCRTIVCLLFSALILGCCEDSLAQLGTIVGSVEDAKTELPLAGANVILVETSGGVASELDGSFVIPAVRVGTYAIRISFVGYQAHEEQVVVGTDTLRLSVRLRPDYALYDEIVVTGMATEREKATADVAVSRVNARKFLENNEYRSVEQLLTGKVSGLTIQTATGNVAGGTQLILRTKTGLGQYAQPTIYVDGVRIESGPPCCLARDSGGQTYSVLAQLNPDDIEKVDVLKGPAGAALYGTSGADGVILITTSRGAYGAPVTANYSLTVGANSLAKKYDSFTASTPDAANAIFRTGRLIENTLDVSGGSQSIRFFASYDRRNEDGHTTNNSQDRDSFRASIEAIASAKVTLRATASYLTNTLLRPENDVSSSGYLANVAWDPIPYGGADSTAIENLKLVTDLSRFLGAFDASYNPVTALTIHAGVGVDRLDTREDSSLPYGNRSNRWYPHRFTRTFWTNLATYKLDAKYFYSMRHDVSMSTIVGVQAFDHDLSGFGASARDFESSIATTLQAADLITFASNFDSHSRELGLFVTQQIAFQNRLFVTLGLRRDYASTIGQDAPSIFYPRASFALRLDRIFSLQHVNFLKVRSAYGQAGNLPGPLAGVPYLWTFGDSPVGPALVVGSIGNPDIQPERIAEFEVGLEIGVLSNRLSFDGTYYRQHATNSKVPIWNPPSSGLTASPFLKDIGSADGWGIETALSATPVHSRRYTLEMTLMWQWQDNKITSLGDGVGFGPVNWIAEGLPRLAYYGWTSRATFDGEGRYTGPEIRSEDGDGDGIPDRVFLGVPWPTQNGSFLLSLHFLKNFRLNVLADWQLGQKLMYGDDFIRADRNTNARRNIARVQIGEVSDPCDVNLCDETGNLRSDFTEFDVTPQPVGSDAYRDAAEIVAGTETVIRTGSGTFDMFGNFVDDADFIKLREISLRYDFTNLIQGTSLGRLIRTASFALAGRNLLTGTSFAGPDPEASALSAFGFVRTSHATLPQPRTVYGLLSIGF